MSAAERLTLDHIEANKKSLLAELHRRQGVVRDFVRGVAHGYKSGLYLWGRPGTAKTHTVLTVLEREIKEPYVYQRGHLTPLGLFELIAENSVTTIVLDDLASILKSDVALQVLLSALEGPAPGGRPVIYRRQGKEVRTLFRAGIVCVSNRELHDDEVLSAFKSRVHTLNYDPSDAQLGALMMGIAECGWPTARPTVTPDEAATVARLLIGEMLRLRCRFDLRLFVNKALPGKADVPGRAAGGRARGRPGDHPGARDAPGPGPGLDRPDRQVRARVLPPPGGN
jgi:hypothetical protein